MSDCTLIREGMPLLLTEALEGAEREAAHLHIEQCEECSRYWNGLRETWSLLEAVPDQPVPDNVRSRFLAEIDQVQAQKDNVVSFWRTPATRWLSQAAAVVVLVGGSYFAGNLNSSSPSSQPDVTAVPIALTSGGFSLAANRLIKASELAPQIEGAPTISNVRFIKNPQNLENVSVSFDLTSNVTVTGARDEKAFVSLVAYLLQDRSAPSPAQHDTIQWVSQTYGNAPDSELQIVGALANVLKSDSHEGVRLEAIETLRTIPAQGALGESNPARDALIEVLKNDPNPAIRIKAVEALTNMALGSGSYDPLTIETLREKASQADENPYVRVKAAEALSQMNL